MSGILWSDIYNSGDKDCGGYLTTDRSGNIVLHGRSDAFPYEYFKVAYTSGGTVSGAVYDDLEMSSDSSWLGVWETGREYRDIERTGADSAPYTTCAYACGTGKTLIEYTTDTEGFPSSFGGMTAFSYINAANDDIGYRIEFDNNDAIVEALPIPGSDGGWMPTKFEGYDMDGHIGSTWWLLWDTGITIEKTSGGQYFAYSFDTDIQSLEEWEQSLAPVALPDPLPALPELGDWWKYCQDNEIIPEFPPLSTVYQYGLGRVIERVDDNPFLKTTYNYSWDYELPGQVKQDMSYDYDNDGTKELVSSKIYNNGADYNISHIGSWQILHSYTYYLDSGRIESETHTTADRFGNTYYRRLDENYNFQGYGRPDRIVRSSIDPDGAISYVYTYYNPFLDSAAITENTQWTGTRTLSAVTIASGNTLTISDGVSLNATSGITGGGSLSVGAGSSVNAGSIVLDTVTIGIGTRGSLQPAPPAAGVYSAAYSEQKCYSNPDFTGLIVTYTFDEKGNKTGAIYPDGSFMKITKDGTYETLSKPDSDGFLSYKSVYVSGDPEKGKIKYCYKNSDFTNLFAAREYDKDGNLESEILNDGTLINYAYIGGRVFEAASPMTLSASFTTQAAAAILNNNRGTFNHNPATADPRFSAMPMATDVTLKDPAGASR